MRNLTIRRTKTFVAALAKVKVYIEDNTSAEITISNVPCRKIGELRSGEQVTFQVGEDAAKIFVICDKMSKEYCCDLYQLNAGQEDVFLSGQNKFNPINGNAFRFDNNNSEQVIAFRKSSTQKGVGAFVLSIVFGVVLGLLSFWLVSSAF